MHLQLQTSLSLGISGFVTLVPVSGNAPSAHDYFATNIPMNCFIDKQDSSVKMLELASKMGETLDDTEREAVFKELQDYYLNDCLYSLSVSTAEDIYSGKLQS